jgi:hypothetical protein
MRGPVIVGSAFVAQYPDGGGNFWVPAQYLLGLRSLGIEAYWVELLWTGGDRTRGRSFVETFRRNVEALGVADWVTLVYFLEGGRDDPPGEREHIGGLPAAELGARSRDALLLNLANSVPGSLRGGYARTALLDIDPGPFQIWAREYDLGVGRHDVHLTIGQNLGAADSPVPAGDVDWKRVWPAVHLPAWPEQPVAAGGRYTTVTQWWTGQYAFFEGESYDCNKRPGFMEVLDLPRQVPAELELAANLHPGEVDDRRLFTEHGWHLAEPGQVAASPEGFRRYVQGSRGEFSCAKPAYVKARPGWVSDRTICYLASGRPCVVQATGAENHLRATAGLRFFRTIEEAAEALRAVEADYAAASRAARQLAREVFATGVVLPKLLAAASAA